MASLDPLRVEEIRPGTNLVHEIQHLIERADIVLGDVSEASRSIIYELDLARNLRKPIILMSNIEDKEVWNPDFQILLRYRSDARSFSEFRSLLADTLRRAVRSVEQVEVARTASIASRDNQVDGATTLESLIARANEARESGNLAESVLAMHEVVAVAREFDQPHLLGEALTQLGMVYRAAGNLEAALIALQEALALMTRTSDRRLWTVVAMNSAEILAMTGDFATAEAFNYRILEVARELGEEPLVGWALGAIGQSQARAGRYEEAEQAYRQALAIFERLDKPHDMAKAFANLAIVEAERGDLDRAENTLRKAARFFEQSDDVNSLANVWSGLGSVYTARKEFDLAIVYLQRSLAHKVRVEDRPGTATTLNNLAQAYIQLGDYNAALNLLYQALEIQNEIGDRQTSVTTLSNVGTVLRQLDDTDAARAFFEKALSVAETVDSPEADSIRRHLQTLEHSSRRG